MTQAATTIVEEYLARLASASNERVRVNHFQSLLLRFFPAGSAHYQDAQRVIAGAESGVISARRRGFADFADGDLIVEFKRKLSSKLRAAQGQLWEYYETRLAQAEEKGGAAQEHRLVATDGAEWVVFGINRLLLAEGGSPSAQDGLLEIERFSASPANADAFRLFLERTLFLPPRALDARSILTDFGATSAILAESMRALQKALPSPDRDDDAATAYRAWRDYLARAYGRDREIVGLFRAHTYLASLVKILAYMFLKKGAPPRRREELREILTGEAFERMRIGNFAAADFFAWCAGDKFNLVAPSLEKTASALSHYDFSAPLSRDILQEIYQQIVDHETRHDLGEYYTPDWLCERIVRALKIAPGQRVLDPACGSGSFLRAAAERKISQNPAISVEALTDEITGFDIHPVAVQTAKTTLLMSLGQKALARERKLRLNVHLANTLQMPTKDMSIFGRELLLPIPPFPDESPAGAASRRSVDISGDFRDNYERIVECCDKIAADEKIRLENGRNGANGGNGRASRAFKAAVARRMGGRSLSDQTLDGMRKIARLMRDARRRKMNGIWAYVLTNLAQPFIRRNTFDIVLGNPPWLTFKDIRHQEYQEEVDRLAAAYQMRPAPQLKTQMEIASVFAVHSAGAYLKDGGKMALVMPAGILDKGQHESLRAGAPDNFVIDALWDCRKVSPLFNIPCVVLFASGAAEKSAAARRRGYEKGFGGVHFRGNLSIRNPAPNIAAESVAEEKIRWRRQKTGFSAQNLPASVFSHAPISPVCSGESHYRPLFRNGATIFPNLFYYVRAEGLPVAPTRWENVESPVHVHSDEDAMQMARRPWKSLPPLTGEADPRLMFRVAVGRVLYPFCVHNPMLAHLPVKIGRGGGFEMLPTERILEEHPESFDWFSRVENLWNHHRTERSERNKISHAKNLNYQGKLTAQGGAPWVVVYNKAGASCCAAVVSQKEYAGRFIAEHQTYCFASSNRSECLYLAAVLNSKAAMDRIRPFVERDIETRILELPIPAFRASRKRDMKLAALAKRCAGLSRKFLLNKFGEEDRAGPREHGRIRTQIRGEILKKELAEIDRIVERIMRP